MSRSRRGVLLLCKIAVSIGLLVIAALTVDVRNLEQRLSDAETLPILAAISLLVLQFPLAALRWRLVLKSLGYSAPASGLMRLIWVGQFLTQVLPTFVAGDGVRVWSSHRQGMPLRLAFSSILWDRVLGFGGLGLLSLLMAPRLYQVAPSSTAATAVPIVAAVALAGIATLMVAGLLVEYVPFRFRWVLSPFLDGWQLLRHPRELGVVLLLATCTNVIASTSAWLLAMSLGIDFSLLDSVTLVPAALFASLLPVSIAGWGVREVTLAYLLPLVGVLSGDAVALSLFLGGALMVASLPGLPMLYLSTRDADLAFGEREILVKDRPPLDLEADSSETRTNS